MVAGAVVEVVVVDVEGVVDVDGAVEVVVGVDVELHGVVDVDVVAEVVGGAGGEGSAVVEPLEAAVAAMRRTRVAAMATRVIRISRAYMPAWTGSPRGSFAESF